MNSFLGLGILPLPFLFFYSEPRLTNWDNFDIIEEDYVIDFDLLHKKYQFFDENRFF